MRKSAAFISVLFVLFLSRCANEQALDPERCYDEITNVSFSNDILPILITYCNNPNFGADCHQAGNTYPLTDYYEVQFEVDLENIQTNVLGANATMPKVTSLGPTDLEPCELEKLRVWVAEGYPNN